MRKHLTPLAILLVTLTSFNKKDVVSDVQNLVEIEQKTQLLSVSLKQNLALPKVTLQPDTIYASVAFNDGLFKHLPKTLEDKIISFHLPKGYMVVFAENADGTGESACFVAVESDIKANLPKRLCNNISYIRYIAINNPEKKGTDAIKTEAVTALSSQWYYGWSINRPSFPNQQFVPMTWGKGTATDDYAKYLIGRKDVDHLLSFNEPDNKGQANIPNFDTAITRYKVMQKTGLRLGSPALTQGHAFGQGKWLTEFMAKAEQEKARIDFIAIHWYDWGNQTNNKTTDELTVEAIFTRFVNYVEKVHTTYPDKPIWITEFNANVNRTSQSIHEGFMDVATQWLNAQDYIERYAYFFPKPLPEINADGSLTSFGKYWQKIASKKSFTTNITGDAIIIKKAN
jgi:Glycosyl hydrolase catalytic core